MGFCLVANVLSRRKKKKLEWLKNSLGLYTCSFFAAEGDCTGDLAFAIFVRNTFSESLLETFIFKTVVTVRTEDGRLL